MSYMSLPIERLDVQIDLPRLELESKNLILTQNAIWNNLQSRQSKQIGMTYRPGAANKLYDSVGTLWNAEEKRFISAEKDYSIFVEELMGSYFYELYQTLPFKIGRMRLMGLDAKSCYTLHPDREYRYHIAITTNPQCFMLFYDKSINQAVHIPADGYVYKMDARIMHTALNASFKERVHLVMSEI